MNINCRDLSFDYNLSQERLTTACSVFGEKVVKRIVSFGLYLLGVNRVSIAKNLDIPVDSLKSFIKSLLHDGICAIEDRRFKSSGFLPPTPKESAVITIQHKDKQVLIDLGENRILQIPESNKLQLKIVLLTFANSGLLSQRAVSDTLGLTESHTYALSKMLKQIDAEKLIDHRVGQKQEYRFGNEAKSELIQQYAALAITGHPTSSVAVTNELNKRLDWNLSDRTIRYHIEKLGLPKIIFSLPKLIEDIKKNSK